MQLEIKFWWWLIALGALLLLEGATAQLVSVWFALGALASLIACLLGAPEWLQISLFVLVSAAALVATRPLVKKLVDKKKVATNADRAIGETAVVTQEINNLLGKGLVNLRGVAWTARSDDDGVIIPEGTDVLVERIDGVKLIVKPV